MFQQIKKFFVFQTIILLLEFRCIADTNSFTPKEKELINKLRPLVEDKLYLPYMKTDAFLFRWILDRNLDITAAKEKLLKAIKWREDNNVDALPYKEQSDLDKALKIDISIFDTLGNPVVSIDCGDWDFRRMVLAGKLSDLHLYLIRMMEKAVVMSAEIQKTNPNATQWILFGNYQGFSLRKHGCLPCIPIFVEYFSNYENYYTGSTRNIVLINVRPLMSPGTRNGFKVYASDKSRWDFVDTIIPSNQLPPKYGGNKKPHKQNQKKS